MFERILIANRGEVAARVARTCRRLGVETVCLSVRGDDASLHAEAADTVYDLGPDPVSYLDANAVVAIAKEAGVNAVHPGYGRLADDPEFARAVEGAGLAFIGPSADRADVIRHRLALRAMAQACGIRILEGSERPVTSAAEADEDIERIGFPVAVKPVLGFGEPLLAPIADDPETLRAAIARLGSLDRLGGAYLERAIERPRHVEVEVLSDGKEAVVLGDREVSIRRDGKRLLSEAPAPALDQQHFGEAIRGAMWEAASEFALALQCPGLSSCHFELDAEGRFYFVDYTAGLQLEHTTTEMCTGLDLVEMQLRLAAGEEMPPEVFRAEPTGSALQARVDAASDPVSGCPFESRVDVARWPPAPQGKVRIETGVKIGSAVHPSHHATVATVTTYAPNRHDALLTLDRILAEITLHPLVTNLRLLRKALNEESFRAGQYDAGFLDRS